MVEINRATPEFLPELITYAQNFEDVMLRRALRDIEYGFYIDVGAFHPTVHSVSCWFYQSGWKGINVEPNPKFFELLTAARPRDVNLNFALAGRAGSATLYLHDALSTLYDDIAAAHRQNGLDMSRTVQVETMTLEQLFESYVQSRTVDFLKLDVEGGEGDILGAAGLEKTRPRILVVEATLPDSQEPTWKAWEPALLKKGYLFAWFDGLNRYYVREEDRWRRKSFATPPSVFDSFRFVPDDPRIKFAEGRSVEALGHALDNARQQVSAVQAERDEAMAKRGVLEHELAAARTDLSSRTGEAERMVSLSGHLERALSTALDKLWKLTDEIETARREKVEAEGGRNHALAENARLMAERETLVADRARAENELQRGRGEISRLAAERDRLIVELARREVKLQARADLAAERDALLAEKIRLEGALEGARSEHSRLIAENEAERFRLEREIEAARQDDSRLNAERDRLTVEIARYQIKQAAQSELAGERDRVAVEADSWREAAIAAAYARKSLPEQRHLKLTVIASGRRLKCSISRSRWERGAQMSLALADHAFDECRWQLAARCYADVLEHWPNNASVWVQLGHSLKEAGRVNDAESIYRHALQLNPAVADTHLQLGHVLKLQGRTREAAEAYAAALGADPELEPAAAELLAAGWPSSDVEKARALAARSNRRLPTASPRRRFATLALQKMFQ